MLIACAALTVLSLVALRAARDGVPQSESAADTELRASDFDIAGGDYADQVRVGFQPRSGVRPIRLEPPIDWNMDPLHDRNWRYQLSAWRMLDPIWAEAGRHDGAWLAARVMPWIADWYRYHVGQGRRSHYEWYDMATGFRAQHLAMIVWRHRHGRFPLTPAQVRMVDDLARRHVRMLRRPGFVADGNHGLFEIQGLRLLCAAWQGDACLGEEPYSARMLSRLVRAQFDRRGVHTENSPGYHVFVLRTLEAIRPELFPSAAPGFATTLHAARAVAPWFNLPDGRILPMGDSSGHGIDDKGWSPPCRFRDGAGRCIIAVDLARSGYAVVRTAPSLPGREAEMLAVGGAAHAPGHHDHADELGFVWWAGGRALFTDPGKYSYDHDRWREYFTSARAHNVAGLQGVRFGPRQTRTHDSALESMQRKGDRYVIDGTVRRAGGFVDRRRLVYTPGRALTVDDRIHATPDARPVVYWHLGASVRAHPHGDGRVDLRDRTGRRLASLRLLRGACRPHIERGRTQDPIQGWLSPSYRKRVPADVIEYRCAAGVAHVRVRIDLASRHASGARAR